ncbi:hypothetical protein WJX72_007546 [[Myrmecia] bisecta]|uniref:Uncharacterized protein n=1 Tax=[Myrmecia] bisecta TaxID=41462 RepID=A0AAW1PYU0_9CHLO
MFDDSAWQGTDKLEELDVTPLGGAQRSSMRQVLQQHGLAWPPPAEQNHWTPVLAIGSNASVDQLARKFPPDLFPDGVVIPVLRCVLEEFDVVYSPMIVSYGSCTATLEHSPGTAIAVFVTYLPPLLLQRMHDTEGAYNLCQLNNIHLQLGQSLEGYKAGRAPVQVLDLMYQYNHQVGSLYMPFNTYKGQGGTPVALKEIRATGRTFPALTQRQMQLAVHEALREVQTTGLLAPLDPPTACTEVASAAARANGSNAASTASRDGSIGTNGAATGGAEPAGSAEPSWLMENEPGSLEDWILRNLDDPLVRHTYVTAMSAAAKPFKYADSELLMSFGNLFSDNVK